MVISSYQADVECRGVFTPRRSCASILDDMEATQVSQTFGPGTDPTAQVKLPAVIQASKPSFSDSSEIIIKITPRDRHRGPSKFRSRIRHDGYDVLVPNLGGCDAYLFTMREERERRKRERTWYVVPTPLSATTLIIRPGDHGKLFVTMTAQNGLLSNDAQTEVDSVE